MSGPAETVVIGAGPYGLAIAAHLRSRGARCRVFGDPMASWHDRMPRGMLLKSTPSASSISAPGPGSGVADFCRATGVPPLIGHHPIPVEQFVSYGRWFQERLVPQLEPLQVRLVERGTAGFAVTLDSGEQLATRTVIVASGHARFAHVPGELAAIAPDGPSPDRALSHSGQHHDLSRLARRQIAVIGAGQSALETAALLGEAGADVRLLVRRDRLTFASAPADLSQQGAGTPWKPESPLGPGWSHFTLSHAPSLVRRLPGGARRWLVANILGPSGAWWLRERVEGRVPVEFGERVRSASLQDGRVVLQLLSDDRSRSLAVDHVVAATGYRISISCLEFLAPELRAQIACEGTAPRLRASFESSIPGLYFTGLAAAPTFGPLMRFVAGTRFCARTISAAVAP